MTAEEAKLHYGIYASQNKPRAVQIGKLLIMAHWGDACWDTLTHKLECNTDWIRLGTVRNLDGIRAYQLVIWRLIVTWGIYNER